MLNIRHQEQQISELKKRLRKEREAAAEQLRVLVPKARKAAVAGSLAWGARKALPLLQPLLFALLRRRAGGLVGTGLVRTLGLAVVAFSVWRVFRQSRDGES